MTEKPGPGGSAPAPVPAGDARALRQRFAEYQRDERENTVAEVVYWRQQYKQLAADALAALSKQAPAGDAVALAAECEAMRAAMLELADKIEGNHVISGSPGPLFNMGWSAANESVARRIRAALSREGQADSTGGTTT